MIPLPCSRYHAIIPSNKSFLIPSLSFSLSLSLSLYFFRSLSPSLSLILFLSSRLFLSIVFFLSFSLTSSHLTLSCHLFPLSLLFLLPLSPSISLLHTYTHILSLLYQIWYIAGLIETNKKNILYVSRWIASFFKTSDLSRRSQI